MTAVSVTHDGDDRFSIATRGHVVHVDQPESDGGSDTGPTPTELFVASLASCVAFYARRYLKRHDLPEEGLTVTAQAESGDKPSRRRNHDDHPHASRGRTCGQARGAACRRLALHRAQHAHAPSRGVDTARRLNPALPDHDVDSLDR